jgi:MoaA/NifB/PqqE/SkfB family radical SAM enzyme
MVGAVNKSRRQGRFVPGRRDRCPCLKRQATKILSELHKSKEPVLIAEHGEPSACRVDFEEF